ncbi:GMC oxidoreductase-domain-containing protein [Ustulina deusta]|nr:GMC oxidoreductase-domain-containing protein [Ustulina deusta]
MPTTASSLPGKISVLLVEAGDLDDRAEDVTVPGNVGQESLSRYVWAVTTTPQQFVDNRTRTFSQGRVVGGSTILNGRCWTRGAAADYDAWENLGDPGWGWTDLLPYFLKSENYTTHTRGGQGPVQVGLPRYVYNQTYNFLNGIQELGIPFNEDLNSGHATGTGLVSGSILTLNQSRADARTAYLDPVLPRPNLELLTGHMVTRVLTGADIAANSTAPRYNVYCRKEIILAAGAILSPVLLQISGFGPAGHLHNLNVDVLVHLPGVGGNLQDHVMVQPVYKYTVPDVFSALDIIGDTRDAVREEYLTNRTGPWTATVNAVAFPAFDQIPSQLLHLITNQSTENLPPTYDATLRAGYDAQKTEIRALLSRHDVAAYELMATYWGQLAVSAMHTLSRGTIHARSSSSIFNNEPVIVDPRLCSHAFDCEIVRMGLELNDRLIATDAMAALLPMPPAGLRTQDLKDRTALMETIKSMAHTESHPSGTAAMVPRSAGGVVDTALRVYGTGNLRVVDASVMPLIPSGHIQSAIYTIAETVVSYPPYFNCQ